MKIESIRTEILNYINENIKDAWDQVLLVKSKEELFSIESDINFELESRVDLLIDEIKDVVDDLRYDLEVEIDNERIDFSEYDGLQNFKDINKDFPFDNEDEWEIMEQYAEDEEFKWENDLENSI